MPEPAGPVRIWYMRDNHTFLELPLDEAKAVEMLRVEMSYADGMGRSGMLCSKQIDITLHDDYTAPIESFVELARPKIRAAIAKAG